MVRRRPPHHRVEYDSDMTRRDVRIEMELAGLDPASLARREIQRPRRVTTEGAWVKWDYLYSEGPYGPGEPEAAWGFPEIPAAPPATDGRIALLDFLRLADGDPQRIRQFVARWGPLGLCRHGVPATHWPLEDDPTPRVGLRCFDGDNDPAYGRERLSEVASWADEAQAIVRISMDTADKDAVGRTEDWERTGCAVPQSPSGARATLSRLLNQWLAWGLVWVQVDLDARPRIYVTASGAFGIVARELVRAVLNAEVAICAACGKPFETSRAPRAREDHYCEEAVCKAAARAAASKRLRQRKKAYGAGPQR